MKSILAVATGGAVGAIARFGLVSLTQIITASRFPLGTLMVNTIGCYLIGFLMSLLLDRFSIQNEYYRLFLIVGFLGAFTTFSSYAWETLSLLFDGHVFLCLLNILLNNVLCLTATYCGILSYRWLLGGLYAS